MNFKEVWNKFWFLLWKDDSFKGWAFSIIFIFIFIKFIFFPGLSLVTGTTLPLAIVESCSMYHEGNLLSDYDNWRQNNEEKYIEFELPESDFENFDFKKGLNKGDILFVVGTDPEDLGVGDVIIFSRESSNPVIHRVVEITQGSEGLIFSTIGDNNNAQLLFERNIPEDNIVGKAAFKVAPYLGWIKLIFFEGSKSSGERGLC